MIYTDEFELTKPDGTYDYRGTYTTTDNFRSIDEILNNPNFYCKFAE